MGAAVATQTKPEKIWYFEWLRAFACVAVVMLHCLTDVLHKYSVEEIGLGRAFWWTEFRLFLAWPVPIFLMITGALLLNPEKEVGYRRALAYAKRMGIVLGSFGFVFALIKLVFSSKSFSLAMLPEAILNVFTGETWSHLWYLYVLIGIYLLTPVFKAFIKTASKDELKIFLIILFVLTCLIPFINDITGLNIETLIWFSNPVFYFILGYYLYSFCEFSSKIGALACGAFVIEAAIAGGAY